MPLDLQLQIYMLAGVFGIIAVLLIFIIAALCGKLEKLKRETRTQQREWTKYDYDNYAFNCPTIQQGEELSRRGFVMHTDDSSIKGQRPIRLVNQGNNTFGAGEPSPKKVSYARRSPLHSGDGTRDASSDFSAVMSSETVVIATRDQNSQHAGLPMKTDQIESTFVSNVQ